MKLPSVSIALNDWPELALAEWGQLVSKTSRYSGTLGSDSFDERCQTLRNIVYSKSLSQLPDLVKERMTARALTWLWLTDDKFRRGTLTPKVLSVLVQEQSPRLTRITLSQLGQLYFKYYDFLGDTLLHQVNAVLLAQLDKVPDSKVIVQGVSDPIGCFKQNPWLFKQGAAFRMASNAIQKGNDLENEFIALGLKGYDDGRFGDICRSMYYLETLREIPLGEWHPVLDELLKPEVYRAPFEDSQFIGHAAIKILIDRVQGEASRDWQQFILEIAGDPRISDSSKRYREWWQPLGRERVAKVSGWLAREDLKLFLHAVEEYGKEDKNEGLQRMFPARKRFLEGLYEMGLVRGSRLMLGAKARFSVQKMLKNELKLNFIDLRGQLTDKAIIYVDCGDFCLVEGSHSFKLWVYLAEPGVLITDWNKKTLSHEDLTRETPMQYKAMFGDLPYTDIMHAKNWQNKVFEFLGSHGIELDIEALLSPADYKRYLQKHGIPYINPTKTRVPKPRPLNMGANRAANAGSIEQPKIINSEDVHQLMAQKAQSESSSPRDRFNELSDKQKSILEWIAKNPGTIARHIAAANNLETRELFNLLYGDLADFIAKDADVCWHVKSEFSDLFT